jgi:hypothetical protein
MHGDPHWGRDGFLIRRMYVTVRTWYDATHGWQKVLFLFSFPSSFLPFYHLSVLFHALLLPIVWLFSWSWALARKRVWAQCTVGKEGQKWWGAFIESISYNTLFSFPLPSLKISIHTYIHTYIYSLRYTAWSMILHRRYKFEVLASP